MRVLFTGGAGFIGSHTADKLLEMGHQVKIIDCLKKPVHLKGFPDYIDKSKIEFIYGDVRDKTVMTYALEDVDIVFHFAAYQDYLPDYSTFSHVNTYSTSLMYEIIEEKKLPVRKIIVASSQAVMGEGRYHCREHGTFFPNLRSELKLNKKIWDHYCPTCKKKLIMDLSDEKVINPQNPYGMSKHTQEMIAINLGKRIGIPSVALRYSIVQGSRQSFYNAYSGVCRIFSLSMFFDKQPIVYEDGNSIRDYVNIRDVVDANILVMESDEANYEVFNVGGGKPYTVFEFLKIVAEVFSKSITAKIPGEYRFGDTRHIVSDISKLESLGWKPKRSIYDSVREYKEYLEQQTDIADILDYAQKQMKTLGAVRRIDDN
ncbi:MAG: GDP-mannose 4,6-dehydratase [Armatimonadetes bacterium]|nr:GDP-mannose 4,6-dehydratase [Armatimonadota bacterium]